MIILAGIFAFFGEYLDSALGMGYGTALAPALLLLGYHPLKIIPAILISQFITDIATCFLHHRQCNVNLRRDSADFKIAFVLGSISTVGVIVSAITAIHIPDKILKIYIGILVFFVGILILLQNNKKIAFSWPKIMCVSFVAAFNKGISGGGYGPLVMGGQILSGVNAKNAVGITAFAESLTCLLGFGLYLFMNKSFDWKLAFLITAFALPAVPIAANTVKRTETHKLKKYTGIVISLLGLLALLKK